jgi:leucine rich repeat (LRR) protein
MVVRDTRNKQAKKKIHRGTQMIFGERKHLEEVRDSFSRAGVAHARKVAEMKAIARLIDVRTRELNAINPSWDRKFARARSAATSPRELLRLAASLPADDYLLARALTEHPAAPPELLEALAAHPYSAVRENVARHPTTPARVLEKMAEDRNEPLWFLVAANPAAPSVLRDRLRQRMKSGSPA